MKVYISNYKKNGDDRKVNVRIDKWDTWSMDHTLALIIHPMLVQLKETKHGSPNVDDEDVPEALRSTSAPPKENEWDTDDNWFLRWDWVLDEMIFAFEAIANDNWEDEFHSGEMDIVWTPVDREGNVLPDEEGAEYFRMDRGPNDTHVFNAEGHRAMLNRIRNGTRLFGKYYQGLWD